jgi:hypothetical protein
MGQQKPPLDPRDFRVILLWSPVLLRAQRTATAARPTIFDIAYLKYFSGLRPASGRQTNANPLTPALIMPRSAFEPRDIRFGRRECHCLFQRIHVRNRVMITDAASAKLSRMDETAIRRAALITLRRAILEPSSRR